MAAELTRHADIALRAIINGLHNTERFDGYSAGYRQGQIDAIQVFFEPTPALLEEAKELLAAYAKKADEADAQRMRELLAKALNPNQQER